jgi:protein-disulfide isomerase
MSPSATSGSPAGKKDRREQARETARIEREAQKRRERRNRFFLQGGIGVVVLAIIAVIAVVIVNVNAPAGPGPLNMASNGIVLSGAKLHAVETPALKSGASPKATDTKKLAGSVHIVTYIDYQCPYCEQFETTNEAQLKSMVASGTVTLEIHPVAILDASSGTNKYSTRSANAAACVANFDPNNFYAVNTALFANQPAENSGGRTDAQLLATLKSAGSSGSSITSCVKNKTFAGFVTAATKRFQAGNFSGVIAKGQPALTQVGTPTVFVNGVKYPGSLTDADAFASFVVQAAS